MASASQKSPDIHLPNLYLIGFMGTGKSSVGREVARQLHMRFIDSDWAIEQQAGKSITEIFADEGEAHFRRLEREFIENGHPETGCVISCGGGLPLQPGMPERLKALGVVICLFAPAEAILERTRQNDRRPLLQVEDPAARIRALLAEREPIYMRAGIGVFAAGRQLPDIVASVQRIYQREAAQWSRSFS